MVFNPVNRHCIVAEDFPLLSVGNKSTKYVSTLKYLGHVQMMCLVTTVKKITVLLMERIPWHSYGVSLAIWITCHPTQVNTPALTPARQAGIRFTYPGDIAAIITRSSATAERQRVSYTRLSRLTHSSCTSLSTASVLQLYNRLAKLVSTLSANKPCDICTLSWIRHSRSFKVILIGAGRNPEWSVVVMCN